MFSVNNFYDYLIRTYSWPRKNINLRYFTVNGSREFSDIRFTVSDLLDPYFFTNSAFLGQCFIHDQEPFYFSYYNHWLNSDFIKTTHQQFLNGDPSLLFKNIDLAEFIGRAFSSIRNTIITTSDLNNQDIDVLENDHNFISCYYWYHGIISINWFNSWKYFKKEVSKDSVKFGLYIRDTSGTRSYRQEVIKKLINYRDEVYFFAQDLVKKQCDKSITDFWPDAKEVFGPESSANIHWNDHNKFDIHLVAETVFDSTGRVHLTEKIFKPIVMFQPFIVLSNKHSLKYLRSYGFKTFGDFWDESYDDEDDANKRLQKVIDVVEYIYNLNLESYQELIRKLQPIVDYNRHHFYSQRFEEQLIKEMNTNFANSINLQKQSMFEFPGGSYFKYMDLSHQRKIDITDMNRLRIKNTIAHVDEHYPKLSKQIIKKYNHLF
jgi:hypothetical protein